MVEDPGRDPNCPFCDWQAADPSFETDQWLASRTCTVCEHRAGKHSWMHPHTDPESLDFKCSGFKDDIPQDAL